MSANRLSFSEKQKPA